MKTDVYTLCKWPCPKSKRNPNLKRKRTPKIKNQKKQKPETLITKTSQNESSPSLGPRSLQTRCFHLRDESPLSGEWELDVT